MDNAPETIDKETQRFDVVHGLNCASKPAKLDSVILKKVISAPVSKPDTAKSYP